MNDSKRFQTLVKDLELGGIDTETSAKLMQKAAQTICQLRNEVRQAKKLLREANLGAERNAQALKIATKEIAEDAVLAAIEKQRRRGMMNHLLSRLGF